jgi:hypothetical protein
MAEGSQTSEPPDVPRLTADDAESPPGTPAAFDRVDWASFGSTTLLAIAGYVFTLAPNVTLGFSGLVSTGAMYAGVPHPPGYPAWTLYSWVWIKALPFSNIAWRVAVGSAFAAAVACGLIAMMVSHQGRILLRHAATDRIQRDESSALRLVCGMTAGLTLGFSGPVWQKAVIADIWALSLFLFTLVVFFLSRWMGRPGRRHHLYAAFLLFGLLLTNSQELITALPGLACVVMLGHLKLGRDLCVVVLPLALVLTASTQFGIWLDPYLDRVNGPLLVAFLAIGFLTGVIAVRTRGLGSEWKPAILCGLCLLFGIALYLLVPVAAMTNPPVNWGYARTVEGFEHLIARGQYERVRPTADVASFLKQIGLFLGVTVREFGWFQLLIAALSLAFLRRMDPLNRKWLLGLLAGFVGVGPLLLAMLNPSPDCASVQLLKSFFAVSYAILSLCFGVGLLLIGLFWASARRSKSDF